MEKLSELLVRESIKHNLKWVLNYQYMLERNLKNYNEVFSFNREKYLMFEKTVTKQIGELKEHKKGLSL